MRYRPLSFPVWPLPDYRFPSSAAPFHCPGLSALRQIPTPSPLPVLPPQPRCSCLSFPPSVFPALQTTGNPQLTPLRQTPYPLTNQTISSFLPPFHKNF